MNSEEKPDKKVVNASASKSADLVGLRFRSASDTFAVSFKDIFSSDEYRKRFRKFLEEESLLETLLFDFVQDVENFKSEFSRDVLVSDTISEVEQEQEIKKRLNNRRMSVGSCVSTLKLNAKSIFRRYIQEDDEKSSKIEIPDEMREKIVKKIDDLKDLKVFNEETTSQAADYCDSVCQIFDEAAAYVKFHLEKTKFPKFLTSEEYIEMMSKRLDTGDEGLDEVKEEEDSEDEDELQEEKKIVKGWVNNEDYRSIHIEAVQGRSLRSGILGKFPNAYCVITVGTTSYKTKVMQHGYDPVWHSFFDFPLSTTTSFAEILVFDQNPLVKDKYLGCVKIEITDILKLQKSEKWEEGKWYLIHKEGDADLPNPKARGEVLIKVSLSKNEADPSLYKPLTHDMSSFLADSVRTAVSKKKRRFVQDGFNLDLSYITDRVIAMGFPSQSVEGIYRNKLSTVKYFLDKRHHEHYRIYNLCSERDYDAACFEGRVAVFGFNDHNPCPFGMIDAFCKDLHDWLTDHPQNIAAIHCKAGKGRTGLVICCYMIYTQLFPNATSSLKFYAKRRTKNMKGVTIPSQIRYVHYYDRYLKYQRLVERAQANPEKNKDKVSKELDELERVHSQFERKKSINVEKDSQVDREAEVAARLLGFRTGRQLSIFDRADIYDYLHQRNSLSKGKGKSGSWWLPDDDKHHCYLKKIIFHSLPFDVKQNGENVFLNVVNLDLSTEFTTKNVIVPIWNEEENSLTFEIPHNAVHVYGDVQFLAYYTTWSGGKNKLFQYWLNTRFCVADGSVVTLTKLEIDKANKDKKHKSFPEKFSVTTEFEVLPHYKKNLFSILNGIEENFKSLSKKMEKELDAASIGNDKE